MAVRGSAASPPLFPLPTPARAQLARSLAAAVRAARTRGEALAAVTVRVGADVDPAAVVCASRRAQEPWFVFENPDRDRAALAALGCVRALDARGPDRFARVAAEWRALAAEAAAEAPDGPPGAGLVAVGGFAFAPEGGAAPQWRGFAPASLHVPEVALARRGDDVRLTLAALARPDDTREDLLARLERRLGDLRAAPLPLLDPDPADRARVASVMPPEHYQAAVARAVERIPAEEPVVVKVANIQHLATPVRAQLASPRGAVELAGLMHPTPAVGAEPLSRGAPLIPALEGLDRGWYAGPVGWTDANEDGELCVAL